MYVRLLNNLADVDHFRGGAEAMTSGPLSSITRSGSEVRSCGERGVASLLPCPHKQQDLDSEYRGQSSLEMVKERPKEKDRLEIRSQSEEVEMPNEITSPSRRTFHLAPSRS